MVRAGRWPSGWPRTGSWCWTSPPGWPPGCGSTPGDMAARPARTTRSPVGLAALDGTGILPVARDDVTVSLRLLRPARGARCSADPGGVPAAPAAGRADARRDAPRADREQGPGPAGPD